jgi:very-short-patch-repair endonuclease
VELDGSQHAEPRQARRDADRDRLLASEGYLVIRVWNADLQTEPDDTLSLIFDTARDRLPPHFRP